MTRAEAKHVTFITLGCAKNEVDTAHMTARLVDAGYRVIDQEGAFADDTTTALDAIIVNTCSFLQEAIEENLEIIFDIANLPRVMAGETKLVVAGCMPARFGSDLAEELTEPDLFIPCPDESSIVPALDQLLGIARSDQNARAIEEADPRLLRRDDSPSAYVKISDGCDRFCSFCAIPYIRGRYHSFTYERVSTEVRTLVDQGVAEIVLIAQDTAIWGSDLEPARSLAWLLDHLASDFPDTWFRVLYIQPEFIDDALLETFAAHDNICNYLDIPFQHVDRALLESMNRHGGRQEFDQLIARIRSTLPDVALRTTVMVGYPGETEAMFESLCDFIADIDFDYVGIFAFSPEEGTRAAALPDQVDEDTKQERLRTLRDIADTVSRTRIARHIGTRLDVLVLGCEEDGQLFGRCKYQAPDVDGVTYLDAGKIGQIVPVLIEDTLYYEMEGTRAR